MHKQTYLLGYASQDMQGGCNINDTEIERTREEYINITQWANVDNVQRMHKFEDSSTDACSFKSDSVSEWQPADREAADVWDICICVCRSLRYGPIPTCNETFRASAVWHTCLNEVLWASYCLAEYPFLFLCQFCRFITAMHRPDSMGSTCKRYTRNLEVEPRTSRLTVLRSNQLS